MNMIALLDQAIHLANQQRKPQHLLLLMSPGTADEFARQYDTSLRNPALPSSIPMLCYPRQFKRGNYSFTIIRSYDVEEHLIHVADSSTFTTNQQPV